MHFYVRKHVSRGKHSRPEEQSVFNNFFLREGRIRYVEWIEAQFPKL